MAVMHLIGLRRNKRTGIWEYRRAIPRRLRPYHSSGEFKRSTGTTKKVEAERLALAFIAQFNALVAGLMVALERAERSAQPIPLGEPGPERDGPVVPVTPEELRTMAGEIGRSLIDKARKEHLAKPTSREPFRLNSAIPPSNPGDHRSAPWGTRAEPWAGHRFMLLAPKSYGVPASAQRIVTDAAREVAQERFGAARFGDPTASLCGPAWETLCEFTRDALDGAYAILQQSHRGSVEWTAERFAESFPEAASPATTLAPTAGPKITSLAEHWKAGKERTDAKTFDRYSRALAEFAGFLGHDDPERVQRGDFQRWLVSLSEVRKLSAKTINEGYRAGVKVCFAAAAEAGALAVDPLAGVKFKIKADRTKAAARHPYSDEDAERLLSASRSADDPAVRWLPWLMAYSGARIGEVAQLYPEDVRVATASEADKPGRCAGSKAGAGSGGKGSVYFLRITDEGEGQRLKNASSRRDVPLHSAVIAEGFLRFVEKAKAGQFLFPDLTMGKYGHKGDGASRVYRKWARKLVGITDERLTAHSWRHRFEDQLRNARVHGDVRDALTGHANNTSMGGHYGHGHSLATKAEAVRKVPKVKLGGSNAKRG